MAISVHIGEFYEKSSQGKSAWAKLGSLVQLELALHDCVRKVSFKQISWTKNMSIIISLHQV